MLLLKVTRIYSWPQLIGICHTMFRMDCNSTFSKFLN